MKRITMNAPLVEMPGDEMTRVLWTEIRQRLIEPFVELKTEVYDLSLHHRDETDDAVTHQAAEAIRRWKVGVKCATITPTAEQARQYGLKRLWKSPNGTIRAALGGTVFRAPILTAAAKPYLPRWTKPITIARHGFGDLYQAAEYRTKEPGKAELIYTEEGGREIRKTVAELPEGGVLLAQYNTAESVRNFAEACFQYALSVKQDLWFSAKDTVSAQYDGLFREIFERTAEKYEDDFLRAGIRYRYRLIDSAAAAAIRSEGGFVWACKNYDGDVLSDLLAAAYGSIAMMSSVLVSPDGCFEFEAAHGTVPDQFLLYRQGKRTSVNPVATLWAWSGALRKRGEYDALPALCEYAQALEDAVKRTVAEGIMTDDLAELSGVPGTETVQFLDAVADRMMLT